VNGVETLPSAAVQDPNQIDDRIGTFDRRGDRPVMFARTGVTCPTSPIGFTKRAAATLRTATRTTIPRAASRETTCRPTKPEPPKTVTCFIFCNLWLVAPERWLRCILPTPLHVRTAYFLIRPIFASAHHSSRSPPTG
jgi:hypothetical protein